MNCLIEDDYIVNIASLFDGISCARVALERAGIKVDKYYASEVDKYAIQIAQKNYPDTIQLGDITKLRRDDFKEDIDILIGGSPCQDLSIAKNNRQGLSGSRSGLFYEYLRVLKETKPKYFILENVNSMPKEAKGTITKELFNIQPIMINASLVSAQNRKRLFWVGKLVNGQYEQVKIELPKDKGILLKDILKPKVDEKYQIKDKSSTIRTSGRGSGIDDKHNWDTIRLGQFNNGGQGDRIYSTKGKSVAISANGGGRGAKTGLYEVNEIIRKLTPIECERLQSLPDNYTEGVSNTQRYKALGNAFNVDVIVHIFNQMIY
jgi:DNA-cytosine methyltransferase